MSDLNFGSGINYNEELINDFSKKISEAREKILKENLRC
jgi:hypothetical protein